MSFEHWDMVESMRNTNRKYHQSVTRNAAVPPLGNTISPSLGMQPFHHSEYPPDRHSEYNRSTTRNTHRTATRNTVTPPLGIHTEMVFVSIYHHYY